MSHFIKKPSDSGEWGSETLFRQYCMFNKIEVVSSQQLICKTCGSFPASDTGGKCVVCGASDFTKADFAVRGLFPVFVQGDIHDAKLKVEERDAENYEALVNRGILPIYVTSRMLKRAIGK